MRLNKVNRVQHIWSQKGIRISSPEPSMHACIYEGRFHGCDQQDNKQEETLGEYEFEVLNHNKKTY